MRRAQRDRIRHRPFHQRVSPGGHYGVTTSRLQGRPRPNRRTLSKGRDRQGRVDLADRCDDTGQGRSAGISSPAPK